MLMMARIRASEGLSMPRLCALSVLYQRDGGMLCMVRPCTIAWDTAQSSLEYGSVLLIPTLAACSATVGMGPVQMMSSMEKSSA